MPATALKIEEQRLIFMTVSKPEGGVDVDIFLADENFVPQGKPSLGVAEQNEEEYHIELRKKAKERGQYVPEFSTNPEWNPE